MKTEIIPAGHLPVAKAGGFVVPRLIVKEGEKATRRFLEFFTANIRNPNTRTAYAQAVAQFLAWCEERRVLLGKIEPLIVAVYIEQHPGSPPTLSS
jgi:hypothetical protein